MWRTAVVAVLFVVLFTLFGMAEWSIGWGVRRSIQTAQGQFPGDRVKALVAMVECESCGMQERNRAVWALGQLDDPRALPVLERHHTGKPCDHMREVCQETLRIALRHLRHEDNNRSESFLWRWMLPVEN